MLAVCRRNFALALRCNVAPLSLFSCWSSKYNVSLSRRSLLTNHYNTIINHNVADSLRTFGIASTGSLPGISKIANTAWSKPNQSKIFQLNQSRNIQKIVVKNRHLREFIQISAKFSKVILFIYFGAIFLVIMSYKLLKFHFNQYNYLPTENSFSIYFRSLYILGLFFSKIHIKNQYAHEFFLACLRAINDSNNLPFDIESDDISYFLSLDVLQSKNLEFIHVYCDLLIRLAILKSLIGDDPKKIQNLIDLSIDLSNTQNYINLDNFSIKSKKEIKKKFLSNLITFDLLANALIIKANMLNFELNAKDPSPTTNNNQLSTQIEFLYLNALKILKLNDPNKSNTYKSLLIDFDPSVHLNDNSNNNENNNSNNNNENISVEDLYINKFPDLFLTRELLDYSNELAVFYTKSTSNNNNNLDIALKIFLSNLKSLTDYQTNLNINFIKDKNSFGIQLPKKKDSSKIDIFQKDLILNVNDVPKLKLYVSEILWAKHFYNISIKWCQQAINESYVHSRSDSTSATILKMATNNLIHMYQYSIDNNLVKDHDSIQYYKENIESLKISLSEIEIPSTD
ncbi:uncharacterized protein ASCRUDRAFT_107983 [Ascoidea rubescens DSM 1968]|uniref:Uncharacterized protein n=1 Tax=Ascoidea rubescens DSM 1968 TaxID=1344418 RepID=A0A1D2VEG5_9ASCO|nr:hypothetical protein ASCRUDRAFT_107983 [Ascoidea rubescens DSM 1968]ODV59910.1 hypothetical protein ASCRUDRAFT_107983 [Ascoidea rubescens DSM 1968]